MLYGFDKKNSNLLMRGIYTPPGGDRSACAGIDLLHGFGDAIA